MQVSSTFKQAWEHTCDKEREKGRLAIKDELNEIRLNNVWTEVDRNQQKPIKLKWVFVIKADGRYTSRLVALGYCQVYGKDYTDMYSPMMSDISLRLLLLKSMEKGWSVGKIDVKTAFLKTKLKEEIYVELPHGSDNKNERVGRLNAALYGLKQASKQFTMTYAKF